MSQMTADRIPSDEELDKRAKAWFSLMGDVTDSDLLPYVIRQVMLRRGQWRGQVHADEFFRIYHRVVNLEQVWSEKHEEWIYLGQAMEKVYTQIIDDSNGKFNMSDNPITQFESQILDQIYGG